MATERLHRTLNKPRGRKAARRVNDGNAYGALSVPLRALPNSTAIVIHHAVLRKRRGGARGNRADYSQTVASVPHHLPFCTDFPLSGLVAAKTVCHRDAGW